MGLGEKLTCPRNFFIFSSTIRYNACYSRNVVLVRNGYQRWKKAECGGILSDQKRTDNTDGDCHG